MKTINKLTIFKNKRIPSNDGHFIYKFVWSVDGFDDIVTHMVMQPDELNRPTEVYDIDDMKAHKESIGFTISDDFVVEEVLV